MSFTGFSDDIDPATTVENAPFWPDLNLADFQEAYRLPVEYREKLLMDRLRLAMVWVNSELSDWHLEKEAAGAASLNQVPVDPGQMIGETHPLVLLYVRAVSSRAKAELLSDYQTMMRKSDAGAKADTMESEDTADKWYGFAVEAVNKILGNTRIHAELL